MLLFLHLSYCTAWGQTSESTVRPLSLLYKQALKILEKPIKWHHCKDCKLAETRHPKDNLRLSQLVVILLGNVPDKKN